ncbi:ATP-grasp domain-containing protein [Pseudomonas fluorescens]|uniref:ATP-grasp domain-containing protein n=1 Tax=Pseudomonas fluorescens TaxID=294 RepID=A0A944DFB7_PSEFL|nr:ATP-grasp domain-containing protein [Pseudomonas fluorescens]MBT2298084.1 ATP-grasp domain-containing protein [Pseudomonas fluorescens]MBT2309793.1 ATP-grasp domain-containing protein [Pseudomonas fluorescens]MBT2314956.1 ATP-grasp domain-containing protein [Pseudomonas fluorescens]MBT2327862.1 ATP-grasp domain-containing protein [Pseudomonas fluorescens]MBT2345609.1 ATP-grasp domain-containing protein [Pseudomonas fluorescens]
MKKKILYVYSIGGPPLDYFYPKMVERASVHTCIVSPVSAYNRKIIERYSDHVEDFSGLSADVAMERVYAYARKISPDALFSFAEFLLNSVSNMAESLGLRGVGSNVMLARNKILMRQRWATAGIPQPLFCPIRSLDDLPGTRQLRLPFLIKLAYGAGSIAQQIIRQHDESESAVMRMLDLTEVTRQQGDHEFSESQGFPQLIAEEIIESTTDSWYEEEGYGDYLSVEGLVRDGQYYPIAMTSRLRTIEPFTELGNVAPCVLDSEKKQRIVQWVSRSIDALGLQNCATHTELKLMANGEVSFLETAARMGGVAIAKELDEVFGVDYVGLFLDVILGNECEIPGFEETPPRCAAASIALIGCDSLGTQWTSSRVFEPSQVDWKALTGHETSVNVELAQSISPGAPFPPYDLSGGVLNYAGQAFLISTNASTLKASAYKLLDGLEQQLPESV